MHHIYNRKNLAEKGAIETWVLITSLRFLAPVPYPDIPGYFPNVSNKLVSCFHINCQFEYRFGFDNIHDNQSVFGISASAVLLLLINLDVVIFVAYSNIRKDIEDILPCMTERNIGAEVADLQFINPVPTPLLVMIRIFSRAHSVITIFPLQSTNIMSFPINSFRYFLEIFQILGYFVIGPKAQHYVFCNQLKTLPSLIWLDRF